MKRCPGEALRARHRSPRTEQAYCHRVKRFIFLYNVRRPGEMGEPEGNAVLTDPATQKQVSASVFWYRSVLNRLLGRAGEALRARRPQRVWLCCARAV